MRRFSIEGILDLIMINQADSFGWLCYILTALPLFMFIFIILVVFVDYCKTNLSFFKFLAQFMKFSTNESKELT